MLGNEALSCLADFSSLLCIDLSENCLSIEKL